MVLAAEKNVNYFSNEEVEENKNDAAKFKKKWK